MDLEMPQIDDMCRQWSERRTFQCVQQALAVTFPIVTDLNTK